MTYPAIVTTEGKRTLVMFPDCPGCQTFAEPHEDVVRVASEALSGWLEVGVLEGEAPARPSEHVRIPPGAELIQIPVPAGLAKRIETLWSQR